MIITKPLKNHVPTIFFIFGLKKNMFLNYYFLFFTLFFSSLQREFKLATLSYIADSLYELNKCNEHKNINIVKH